MNIAHRFNVFADYFQFILMDEQSSSDFGTVWTEVALERMLAVGNGALCLGTLRNVDVDVDVILCPDEPVVDLSAVDHAVEASIAVSSGSVVVMGCSGYLPDAPRISVAPGTYRVLYLVSGIDSIQTEWDPAEDSYIVYLWPGASREAALLRHWQR